MECGSKIDEWIFDEMSLDETSNFIENSLKENGINPVIARAWHEYWTFHKGDLEVRYYFSEKNVVTLEVPICNFPKENIQWVLEYMLNYPSEFYTLWLNENIIYYVYNFSSTDLRVSEEGKKRTFTRICDFFESIEEVAWVLIKQFWCELTHYSKSKHNE